MNVSIGIFLFEVHVAQRVHDKDLAVLSHDAFLSARRTRPGWSLRHGRGATASLLAAASLRTTGSLAFLGGLLAGLLLLPASLLAIHSDRGLVFVARLRRWRRSSSIGNVEARNGEVIAPGRIPSKLDVALNELALAPPAHVQGEVVEATTANEQNAEQYRAKTWPIAAVVVFRALPRREPVLQEVVVSVAAGATQDVGDDA
ncbi:hypothetical protein RRF57_012099 [Xylaria bambusicola]|uniref:Uncharacterized protein n=1 Tax=Xylaria bambusicola TaxID=326684 RepID=A0AAN7UUP2_9PEZI